MMKKKVKKIPKYNQGVAKIDTSVLDNAMKGKFNPPTQFGKQLPMASMLAHEHALRNTKGLSADPSVASGGSGFGGWGGTIGAAATAGGKMLMDAFGVEDNSQLGVTLNTSMQGAEIGGAIVPGWGHLIGGVAGGLIGATKSGSVDENTGEITYGGIWGHSKDYLRRKSNMIKNSIQSKSNTQNIQADYYNDPNVVQNANVLAAEGGIMRKPVDALVSKGELIYNPVTKKLSQVPGSKGKPNKADDVYTRLYEGDVVISNSPTMLMSNGKTPAQNLMGMVDKYSTGGTVKAREAIIKKVVNWLEANKTKPQEYAMYANGTGSVEETAVEKAKERGRVVATTTVDGKSYIKLGDGHWYHNTKGLAGKRVILTSKLRKAFADVEETPVVENTDASLSPGGYNQKWEWQSEHAKNPMYQQLFGLNKKYNLVQPLRQVELSGYNYGPSYGEYNPDFGNYDYSALLQIPENYQSKPSNNSNSGNGNKTKTSSRSTDTPPVYETVEEYTPVDYSHLKQLRPDETVSKLEKSIFEPVTPEITGGRNWKRPLKKVMNQLAGIAPVIAAMIDKPAYHKEEAVISPAKYIPVNADPRPLLRAADESRSIGNYNFANMGGSTGAYMAHSAQLASDQAKRYADAYKWQQDTQNKLIAQNVGIYNNWTNRYDAARYRAIENTMANEAAADAQRDTRIKDAMRYYRDWLLTPFLKQYLSSGAYKENLERLS